MSTQEATDDLIDFIDNSYLCDDFYNWSAKQLKDHFYAEWEVKHPFGTTIHVTPSGYPLHDVNWDNVADHFEKGEKCSECDQYDDDCECEECDLCNEKIHKCIENGTCNRCFLCDQFEEDCDCVKCKDCNKIQAESMSSTYITQYCHCNCECYHCLQSGKDKRLE